MDKGKAFTQNRDPMALPHNIFKIYCRNLCISGQLKTTFQFI